MNEELTAPDQRDYYDRTAQEEHELPLRSSLGSACCPECGEPLGRVKRLDGTYRQGCQCGGTNGLQ